eukprot:gene15435-17010_t
MIINAITNLGLSLKNCRGQGYDGAGNMAGKCSGAATRIQNLYSQALHLPYLDVCKQTRPLTKQLQARDMDALRCTEKVSLLLAMIIRFRQEMNICHNFWYEEAVALAANVGTIPSKPRTAIAQQHRSNVPADSVSEYFRRTVSVPFLGSPVNTNFKTIQCKKQNNICKYLHGLKILATIPDIQEVIERFAIRHPRRMKLVDILDSGETD